MANETTTIPPPSNATASNGTIPPEDVDAPHLCKMILYEEMVPHVRTWDFLILVPNMCFMLFLILKFRSTKAKLSTNSSPIIVTFYSLVIICVFMSVLRCIVSMSVNASSYAGEATDKVLWVAVRFFLFSMEISVLVFGLAFGHLDTRTSIRRVLLVTTLTSLTYSVIQGTLELIAPDEKFYIPQNQTRLYSHGGTGFWAVTCIISSLIYGSVVALPYTPARRRIPLPAKRSFYIYCGILSFLNLIQGIGSLIYRNDVDAGLCMIDLTTYGYFSFFHILVYWTFLSTFFSVNPTSLLFSYKHQMDDFVHDDPTEAAAENVESVVNDGPHFSGETSILSLKTEEADITTMDSSAFASAAVSLRNGGQAYGLQDDDDDDTLVSSIMSDSSSYGTAKADESTEQSFRSLSIKSPNQSISHNLII